MHSRIFQLETNVDNVTENPLIESDILGDWDYPGWFIPTIADYVDDHTDREDDISWFISNLQNHKDYIKVEKIKDDDIYYSITFLNGFKKEYFKDRFEAFKKEINNITLDNFCESMNSYRIRSLIEDKYSFYIYGQDDGLYNLDAFVRDNLIEGETYYFGTTLDYHC